VITRKILEKVATFSSYGGLHEDEDEASESVADSVDPDLVLTTGSDADSSGGSKVVATSIDGEDGLVDVTMKDSNGIGESTNADAASSKLPEKETPP
jgi:ubiquitin carboxyl-terminal hydrolase 4/11/15